MGWMQDRRIRAAIRAFGDACQRDVTPEIETLATIGQPAVEPLLAALSDEKEQVRRSAVSALMKIGSTRAVGPLIGALRDADAGVRRMAAEAVAEIGDPSVGLVSPETCGDPSAIETLIGALDDDQVEVRRIAADALSSIGGERAVDPLIAALGDDEAEVRRAAATGLWRIQGGERAVDPLIGALGDDSCEVRAAAADSLGSIGDRRAVTPLIGALSDADALVRRMATRALGSIGDERAVAPLTRMIGRLNVVEALKALGAEPNYLMEAVTEAVIIADLGSLTIVPAELIETHRQTGYVSDGTEELPLDGAAKALRDRWERSRLAVREALEGADTPPFWLPYVTPEYRVTDQSVAIERIGDVSSDGMTVIRCGENKYVRYWWFGRED
jgi:HEAT repeat protein